MTVDFETLQSVCRYCNPAKRCSHGKNFCGSCTEDNCPLVKVVDYYTAALTTCYEHFNK